MRGSAPSLGGVPGDLRTFVDCNHTSIFSLPSSDSTVPVGDALPNVHQLPSKDLLRSSQDSPIQPNVYALPQNAFTQVYSYAQQAPASTHSSIRDLARRQELPWSASLLRLHHDAHAYPTSRTTSQTRQGTPSASPRRRNARRTRRELVPREEREPLEGTRVSGRDVRGRFARSRSVLEGLDSSQTRGEGGQTENKLRQSRLREIRASSVSRGTGSELIRSSGHQLSPGEPTSVASSILELGTAPLLLLAQDPLLDSPERAALPMLAHGLLKAPNPLLRAFRARSTLHGRPPPPTPAGASPSPPVPSPLLLILQTSQPRWISSSTTPGTPADLSRDRSLIRSR